MFYVHFVEILFFSLLRMEENRKENYRTHDELESIDVVYEQFICNRANENTYSFINVSLSLSLALKSFGSYIHIARIACIALHTFFLLNFFLHLLLILS